MEKQKKKGVVIKGYQHMFGKKKKKKLREVTRKISWNEELRYLNMKEAQKSLNPGCQIFHRKKREEKTLKMKDCMWVHS